MNEDSTHKLVAVQQKQLLELEAEVVERQRALQENMLRLKLMKTPLLQTWAEVRTVPLASAAQPIGGSLSSMPNQNSGRRTTFSYREMLQAPGVVVGDASNGDSETGGWHRYYVRLFQNKKLVCWLDASEEQRNMPPAMVYDLFEVEQAQQVIDASEIGEPHNSRRSELQLLMHTQAVQLKFLEGLPSHANEMQERYQRARRLEAQRAAERARKWLNTMNDMLREITEPDAPPSFQNVMLWVGTWNMGNAPPDADELRHLLGIDSEKHEIYALGMQESHFPLSKEQRNFGSLNQYMSSLLLEVLGGEYRLVEARAMWEIRLIVLAHEDVIPHLEVLDSANEATGIGGVGGNKGGVAIAIALHRSTTLCFVTAHLAAHQEFTKRRNRDCVDIFKGMRSLATAKRPGKRSLDPSIGFDHVFFFGDLNYRIVAPMETVLDAIEDPSYSWSKMHAYDQLREEMNQRRVLCGFTERPPDFPPTFKKLKSKGGKASKSRDGGSLERLSSTDGGADDDDLSASTFHGSPKAATGGKGGGKRVSVMPTVPNMSSVVRVIKDLKPGHKEHVALPVGGRGGSWKLEAPILEEEGEEGEEEVTPRASRVSQRDGEDEQPLDVAEATAERAARLGYNAKRIPSWCDRILYRSHPMCTLDQTGYGAVDGVTTSDHTPVAAKFSVRVMLPADAESKATGDLYQWELSVSSAEVLIPLSALDDEDAAAARTATPEVSVEFCGTVIRTGYTTPTTKARLVKTLDATQRDLLSLGPPSAVEGPALAASFKSTMHLQMTDVVQRLGPQRIALSHLMFQVVADFGHRRVVLGAAVLPMDSALNDPGRMKNLSLYNCGVDGGAVLSVEATLQDAGRAAIATGGASSMVRKSFGGALAKGRKSMKADKDDLTARDRTGTVAQSAKTGLKGWGALRKKKALLAGVVASDMAVLSEDRSTSERQSGAVSLSDVESNWGSCQALPVQVGSGRVDGRGGLVLEASLRSTAI
jgi:hypothetical protein